MRKIYGFTILATLLPLPVLSDSAQNMQMLSLTKKCAECIFSGEDFSLKNLSGFSFEDSVFTDVNLNNANLSKSKFDSTNFNGGVGQSADFSNTEMVSGRTATFNNIDIRGSKFDGAIFYRIMFNGVNLDAATFTSSNGDVQFISSVAKGANFSSSIFLDFSIANSDFSEAKFSGASLQRSKIIDSKLVNANFEGADLSNADLSGSDFSGANFKGANLSDSNLENTNLCNAIGPDGTKLFIGCP